MASGGNNILLTGYLVTVPKFLLVAENVDRSPFLGETDQPKMVILVSSDSRRDTRSMSF